VVAVVSVVSDAVVTKVVDVEATNAVVQESASVPVVGRINNA